jgi:hypothetical protein
MPIASAALTTLALAFPNQRLMHGGAIFGALVLIMSKPGPDFDPGRLLSTLTSRRADEWSQYVTGIIGGNEREAALRTAITQAYEKSLVQAKKK